MAKRKKADKEMGGAEKYVLRRRKCWHKRQLNVPNKQIFSVVVEERLQWLMKQDPAAAGTGQVHD